MDLIIFTSPDAGRAAMAAAFFNALATPSIACAIAAVRDPQPPIDSLVVTSFDALNLGRLLPPSRFTDQLEACAGQIIHVGIMTRSFPTRDDKTIEWDVDSPKHQPPGGIAGIRDGIGRRVEAYLREKCWLRRHTG